MSERHADQPSAGQASSGPNSSRQQDSRRQDHSANSHAPTVLSQLPEVIATIWKNYPRKFPLSRIQLIEAESFVELWVRGVFTIDESKGSRRSEIIPYLCSLINFTRQRGVIDSRDPDKGDQGQDDSKLLNHCISDFERHICQQYLQGQTKIEKLSKRLRLPASVVHRTLDRVRQRMSRGQ